MVLQKLIHLLLATVWRDANSADIIWLILLWKWGRPNHCLLYHENGFFVSALHGVGVNDTWFHQDAAICYTSHATIDVLCQTFDDRLSSRRSFDLTLLNYFLWRAVKRETIKANISNAIAEIQPCIQHENGARKLFRSNKVIWGQPLEPYEWNNITFVTRTIVLHYRKINFLAKFQTVFNLFHF